MRLQEFLTANEWQKMARLIYGNTLQAMTTLTQPRPQNTAAKQTRTLKKARPRIGKSHAPHAAPPKPLPKPVPVKTPASVVAAPPIYKPVKAPRPLPASTRDAIEQPVAKPLEDINLPPEMDQRGLGMLPKNKRGPAIWDILKLD